MSDILHRSALIGDTGGRILVQRMAGGWHLPRWEPDAMVFGHVVGPFNRALRRDLGLDVTTLRYLGRYQDAAADRAVLVYEMEPHDAGWQPPDSCRWASHSEWMRLDHLKEERPFLEAWFAEAASGILPPQRAPWAIRGWFDEAAAWFAEQARRLGRPLTGRVEQERAWGISTVLRAPAVGGDLYFKASGTLFREEPSVTRALAALAPDRIPRILAMDADRAWLVMADFRGASLKDTTEPDRWEEALRAFARLQISCADHHDALLASGAQERRMPSLPSPFAALAHNDAALMREHPRGLSDEQARDLRALLPWVEEACNRLSRSGIPNTILHGDLHSGNVAVTASGHVFFDWSDAAWSHPFLDLVPFFDEGFEGPDPDLHDRLRDAYLEPWTAFAAPDELLRTFDLAQTVGAAYHALSYWMIVESLEPGSRQELQQGVPHFLRLLLQRQATQR